MSADQPMSDVAGAAKPPALSVIVPVRDGGAAFEQCLTGLANSEFRDFELIVVDDGSRDGSAERARRFGARVLVNESSMGPGGARNRAAQLANAEILAFVDADVVVHPDTLGRFAAEFSRTPETAAAFGSYDIAPSEPTVVSTYRNLLHHYFHQKGEFDANGTRVVRTFWAGCGAVRRSVFLSVGGFDTEMYRRPSIEDIELGYRMSSRGHVIRLCRDIQATHLKRWTLRSVIRTDIFLRGVPWMVLMKRRRIRHFDLNIGMMQRLTVMLVGLGWLSLPAAAFWPPAAAGFGLSVLLMVLLNWSVYRFLSARRGPVYAAAVVPLHYLYFVCCLLSAVLGLAAYHNPFGRERGAAADYAEVPLKPLPARAG